MTGYVCKYTPVEIIRAFGEEVCRIEPEVKSVERAMSLTHPNMCSFMKATLEEVIEKNINEIILVNCCDSIRRLYDILKGRVKFIHIIDLPRKMTESAYSLFHRELLHFIGAYEAYTGKKFDLDKFKEILAEYKMQNAHTSECVAVLGARLNHEVIENIKKRCNLDVVNLTCTGTNRLSKVDQEDDLIFSYAKALLNSSPCMRMAEDRLNFLDDFNLKGIIYNTIKFCDFYSFEYASLKNSSNIPILKIETDYSDSNSGQVLTRVDAFLESIGAKKSTAHPVKSGYFAGIDSGSTSTNVVIIDENKNIISYSIVPTGARALESAREAYRIALKKANLKEEDIAYAVSTGYGRISIPFSDKSVTEITCHGRGAFYLDRGVRTVIDIGGQDSKVIRLDDTGNVTDFVMNDKCSAGTGRFLEVMARALEVSIEDMAREITDFKEDIVISSMCTVFAESEVISLIARNKDKNDIIRGLHRSAASRAVSLLDRIGRCGKYMMTGGVAKNRGVVSEIQHRIGEQIIIPFEPQIVGALGAALIAAGEK
ncbi:acyl-CoA dehydratase activase [Thermoanaerobacterium sp. DL9XJH110]|uniref:acyl-CoA dehydratase activase n=1 Tax=Thermoanaerobacterium sp. DL9XJH110 TaxID=3386643 RepID=UPI003BB73C7F